MPEQRNTRFAVLARRGERHFRRQPLNRLGRMRRPARRKKPFLSRGKKLREHQMVSANRCAQLQCAFDMCELQVYTCNYWHASARACSKETRCGPGSTRKARTRHRRMRLPLSQINVHLCVKRKKKKKKEEEEEKKKQGKKLAYDRFDDPCQVDGKRSTQSPPRSTNPADASPSGSPMLTSVPMPRGL